MFCRRFAILLTAGNAICWSPIVYGLSSTKPTRNIRQSQPTAKLPTPTSVAGELLLNHAGSRLDSLDDLPRVAEAFIDGNVQLVSILEVNDKSRCCTTRRLPIDSPPEQDQGSDDIMENKGSPSQLQKIDFSQLITVWDKSTSSSLIVTDKNDNVSIKRGTGTNPPTPLAKEDAAFHRLYQSHVGRGRKGTTLTKKIIANLEEDAFVPALRLVLKAGGTKGMPRLIDSSNAAQELFGRVSHTSRWQAAIALGKDARHGGRFKRFPCIWVSNKVFVNGGWLVVDHAVRAGAEARKLVDRNGKIQSASDERIVRRLECLALGEVLSGYNADSSSIEVDVRQALEVMELPVSPAGATEALVRMELWSSSEEGRKGFVAAVQPWSSRVLVAAKRYTSMLESTSKKANDHEHSRVDLAHIPCICIDSRKTKFRDDAIGIRQRASTGRPLKSAGSKWEVLIHIADVTDIYSSPSRFKDVNDVESLQCLQNAAMRRGSSRYDLAYGPLHLLPPSVLDKLTLDHSRTAITVWVYIDENSGKILDCGVERTIVAKPTVYTYEQASSVLSQSSGQDELYPLLAVLFRILAKWKSRHLQQSEGARKRFARLEGNDRIARDPSHVLVDNALDLYSYVAYGSVLKAKAPVPRSIGASPTSRGGRFATGPLRRAIDGQAQRQLAAVCLSFGNRMTLDECKSISMRAVESTNAIAAVRSIRKA